MCKDKIEGRTGREKYHTRFIIHKLQKNCDKNTTIFEVARVKKKYYIMQNKNNASRSLQYQKEKTINQEFLNPNESIFQK